MPKKAPIGPTLFEGTRVCNKCHKEQPISEFRKRTEPNRPHDARRHTCKTCYKTGRPKPKPRPRPTTHELRERRHRLKQWAIEYLGGQCQICGLKSPDNTVYDFHHKDQFLKKSEISRMLMKTHMTPELLKLEVDKCMLLCANCHRVVETRHVQYSDMLYSFTVS